MRNFATLALTVSLALPVQGADWTRADLERVWPQGVTLPKTMTPYRPSQWAQRTVINNGADYHHPVHENTDDVYVNAPTVWNPNRLFPWRVSGGLDAKDRRQASVPAIALPEGKPILWWVEKIEAGASRPLPKVSWSFPVGTVSADLLLNDGRPFELRLRKKTEAGWYGVVAWEDAARRPAGYDGPGRRCSACHNRAGGWENYGSMIRGGGTVFSFPVLKEGTLEPRADIPVKRWEGR